MNLIIFLPQLMLTFMAYGILFCMKLKIADLKKKTKRLKL